MQQKRCCFASALKANAWISATCLVGSQALVLTAFSKLQQEHCWPPSSEILTKNTAACSLPLLWLPCLLLGAQLASSCCSVAFSGSLLLVVGCSSKWEGIKFMAPSALQCLLFLSWPDPAYIKLAVLWLSLPAEIYINRPCNWALRILT